MGGRGCVTIACCFLFFLSIYLCLVFISWPINCLSAIDCIPFLISFYLCDPETTCSILEYSVVLLIILLPFFTFFYLVIFLMIGVYKSHSSPLPFPTLVYFVLLASIHLLLTPLNLFKSSSYFWVDASLFEPLNPWGNSVWVVMSKHLDNHLCLLWSVLFLKQT